MDMSCEGCVKAVKNKLQTVDGGCYKYVIHVVVCAQFLA